MIKKKRVSKPILNQIKTEYVEAFKNPKLLQTFTLKWKVEAIDRISPLSSNEDVVLEQSKKLLIGLISGLFAIKIMTYSFTFFQAKYYGAELMKFYRITVVLVI